MEEFLMKPKVDFAFDDEKRRDYEARMKAIRDYNQGMIEAMERGMESGMKKGMEKGRTEERKTLIETMLTSMSLDQVSQAIKIPVSDIKQIIEG